MSLYAQWTASYAGTFLSLYFSVVSGVISLLPPYFQALLIRASFGLFSQRARSLAALLVPILSIVANTILGYFLDQTTIRKNVRSKYSYIFIMSLVGGVWVWFTVLQLRYLGLKTAPKYDWASNGFGAPFACYLIFYVAYYVSPSPDSVLKG